MNELKDLLEDLQDYFSNKSDAETVEGKTVANVEYMLAQRIREQLASPSEDAVIVEAARQELDTAQRFIGGSLANIESAINLLAASLRSPITESDLSNAAYAALDGEKTEGETTEGEEKMFIQGFFKGSRLRSPSEQELNPLPFDFVLWYSGMRPSQILKAFQRWKEENQSEPQQSPEVGEDDIEKIAEGLWARHSLSSEHLPDHDELMDKADFTAALKEFNQKSEK
jgi:hypothetical protein